MLHGAEHSSIVRIFLALCALLFLPVACRDEAEPTPTVTWPTPTGQGELQELAFGTLGHADSPGTGEY